MEKASVGEDMGGTDGHVVRTVGYESSWRDREQSFGVELGKILKVG